jgi:PKHD-type hydroxylase
MIYEIPKRNIVTKEEFAYWEDFLTEQELDILNSLPEWDYTKKGRIGGTSANGGYNPEIREMEISWFNYSSQTAFFWEKVSGVVAHVNARFFGFDLTGFHEPAQLGLYDAKTSGFYDWHVDGSGKDGNVPRKLSMALLISDPREFVGGELQLKTTSDNPITVEQKRGRAWFFPSYALHRVNPVTEGLRKSIVLWAGGPAFR